MNSPRLHGAERIARSAHEGRGTATLCLLKTSSMQVRSVGVDRRVLGVLVVDHYGAPAWQVAAAA